MMMPWEESVGHDYSEYTPVHQSRDREKKKAPEEAQRYEDI
jgi:hypothetical protein